MAAVDRKTIEPKTARLEAARRKFQALVHAGGDLKSSAAVPDGLEFVNAFANLAKKVRSRIPKANQG